MGHEVGTAGRSAWILLRLLINGENVSRKKEFPWVYVMIFVAFVFLSSCISHGIAIEQKLPIRLHVYDNYYLRLLVGNPGTLMTFRISLYDDEIHIHKPIDSLSQTFYRIPGTNQGSELFYLAEHRIRLPVNYDPSPPDYAFSVLQEPHDGVFGFGKLSAIWHHWHRATFSPEQIYLGEMHFYAQMDHEERPPTIDYYAFMDGTHNTIALHPNSTYTLLPEHIYYGEDQHFRLFNDRSLCNGECNSYKDYCLDHDHQLRTPYGIYFQCVDLSPDVIWLGSEFFVKHVAHIDRARGTISFSESISCFDQYGYSSSFSIITALYSMAWCTVDLGNGATSGLLIAQGYGYLMMVVFYFCLTVGLRVGRFISGFSALSSGAALILIALNLAAGFTTTILRRRHAKTMYIERFLMISSALLMVWLCSIEEHLTPADFGYLIFLSTALCIYGVFTLIDGYANFLQGWIWLTPLVALHIVFLVAYNLLPAFSVSMMRSWLQPFSAVFFIAVCVCATAWIVQNESYLNRVKKK